MDQSCSGFLKPYIQGTIFELTPGANGKVPHFVFISIYPDLMLKKNMLTDTTYEDCCKLEKNKDVLELEHLNHSWTKRIDMVPLFVGTLLEIRLEYKKRNYIQISTQINNSINDFIYLYP